MNEIRRIISLFVGLLVVLLVISYAFGKLGFYGKGTTAKTGGSLAGLFGKKDATTPTPNASRKLTIKQVVDGDTTKVKTVTVMPNSPTSSITKPTATPTQLPLRPSASTVGTSKGQVVTSIPEAGAETATLPLIATALFGGVYLRRKI